MKFLTEEARRSHTQARRINSYLMKAYFNKELTEREIELLSNSLGLVDFADYLSKVSSKEQFKGLICFFLGKAKGFDALPERILQFASDQIIARAALLTGRFKLIRRLGLTEERLRSIVESSVCAESLLSMEEGNTFIEYLELDISPSLKVKDIFISADYQQFYRLAADNGHLPVLKHLEEKLTEQEKKRAIEARNFEVYYLAAENAHLPVLEHLESSLTEEEKKELIEVGGFYAYLWAAKTGDLCVLKHFESSLTEEEKKAAIKRDDFYAYRCAALNGHRPVLHHLESSLTEEEKKAAIKAINFGAYRAAVQNAHRPVLYYFEASLTEEEKKEAIKANKFYPYQKAAQNGHLPVLKHIESSLTEEEKKQAIEADHFKAYKYAAENGHLPVLKHLEESLTDEEKKNAIKSFDFYSYLNAGAKGHLLVLEHLESSLTEKEKNAAIKGNGCFTYRWAAENGHLPVLKHLEASLSLEEKKEAIKANGCFTYRMAAQHGHLPVLKHLEASLSLEEKKEAIKWSDFIAYQCATKKGHLHVLEHFEASLTEEEKKAAIKAGGFNAYRLAAKNGELSILQHFESSITSQEKKTAIKAKDYLAYQWAAQKGALSVLYDFEASLTIDEKIEAIKADDFNAYRSAAYNEDINTVKHLLKTPACLAYAEKHDYEYGEKNIYSYVSWCIKRLKIQKGVFEGITPNEVFDIPEHEAIHTFYLLRNLIRRGVDRTYGNITRGAEELSDEIRFLLSIPAVKSLCHQVVTVNEECPGQENELLRFANRIGNREAAGILLELPQVIQLAERSDFYPEGIEGELNLREIAEDRESSMVALSESERRFVEKTKSHYDALIKAQGGIDAVFLSLKAELKSQYETSPATIKLPLSQHKENEAVFEEMALPFEWEESQVLKTKLTDEQYEAALRAYYEHDAHTAYRYLSKPNKWIHPEASYVYISDDREDRWSTFEEYRSLIALFYTAAFDEAAPAIDGYTLESRKALFVKQLALIARAHNWDRRDENGVEHDDKEADKPSCFSGVNRRLFQSILGHGLFKVVTDTVVIQALNEQIRRYFESLITFQNIDELKAAFEGMIFFQGDMQAYLNTLKALDISKEKKADMIAKVQAQLSDTYKANFDEHKARFVETMNKYLNSGVSGAHFIDYQGPCGLDTLLEQIEKKKERGEWVIGKWRHSIWQKAHVPNKTRFDGAFKPTTTHHC